MSEVTVIAPVFGDVSIRPYGNFMKSDRTDGRIVFQPGGTGTNVAAWLTFLGVATELIAFIGDDPTGVLLEQLLRDKGIIFRRVSCRQTGMTACVIDESGERHLIAFEGEPWAGSRIPDASMTSKWIHIPAHTIYRGDISRVLIPHIRRQQHGIPISMDINSTKRLAKFGVLKFISLVEHLAPYALFMNRSEADLLLAHCDISTLANITIVHSGPDPTLIYADGKIQIVSVPPLQLGSIVDSTGAGDAFAAAYIAKTINGDSSDVAVEHAHNICRIALQTFGAQPMG